ncbi:ATP-grasp domain-containing protein [Mesorhizobium sp.]|uniref:ATP-grasp domain-containing protein n=1 Tax=Mesorhizobium sp. TaxID=1871066 RepID=UPI001221EF1B|nr:ATP-grasp domain-containing protein [Mesorhizobium sp.]TIN08616.1 MAG: ATP-grasp domain-containing protein [Mesorhizobium sp.]
MAGTIVLLEALTFGLGRLAEAATRHHTKLCLLTRNKEFYRFELNSTAADGVDICEVDTFKPELVKRAIQRIGDVKGLISATDTWSLVGLDVASQLNFPRPDPQAVRIARDKAELRKVLHSAGLSTCKSVIIQSWSQEELDMIAEMTPPVIIKDRSGTGSQHVWILNEFSELELLRRQISTSTLSGNLLVEPYFNGTLYSAETLTWDRITRVIAFTSRVMSPEPWFREEAAAMPIIFPQNIYRVIEDWIGEVLACIQYDRNFAHCEFILTSTGPELVEINPRLGGGLIGESLCRVYDTNIYDAFIQMALGERPVLIGEDLTPQRGIGQRLMYPTAPCIFERMTGVERLQNHIGSPELFLTVGCERKIEHVGDQRGCVAILLGDGETSEFAMLNTLSAASKLGIASRPAH